MMDRKNSSGRTSGFTLAELLVVVAIIGVLVAVSIPIFTSKLHKARVATDWANVRSYYSEIMADYISTGEHNPRVPGDRESASYDYKTITFLDGQTVKLHGYYMVTWKQDGTGYQIAYNCPNYDLDCTLILPFDEN